MSEITDTIISKLKLFGFSEEEAVVYIDLTQKKHGTALKLSKDLKMPRTRVYRILDKLIEKGFVYEEIKGYGTKYFAESYEKLNLLIDNREREIDELKTNVPLLFNQLAQLQIEAGEGESRIVHYRGLEGLKQVTWNSTKVKGAFRIYEVNLLHNVVDYDFAEKARKEFAKNQSNKFFQLTNSTEFKEYTSVKEHVHQWQVRHIPKEELNIKFEIQMYNDVLCMFEYTDKDIFIVEIYNNSLVQMQKQLFDMVWKNAQPMQIINDRGAAKLVMHERY